MFGRKRSIAKEYEATKGKPVPVAVDPGAQRKQDLWDYVQKFVRDHKFSCPEDVHQSDRAYEYAPGFISGCADIVGYHKED